MSQLVIAEKPSVAQAIARVIGATERKDGFIEGGGYIVSWCVGHLVELAAADRYSPQYSRWAREDLPILPEPWQFSVSAATGKQFGILKGLMERPDVTGLIEATDAGREGELIFRLVYHQAGCTKPFERLWISSMEDSAIRAGFENLLPGEDYDTLYEAALCRSKADWLVGINGTRLFTTLYGGKTLNVGRVMTPTLALLAEREQEIAGFKKESFYVVELDCGAFHASSGRFQGKTDAEKLRKSCLGKPVLVQSVTRQEKTEKPPKLYDLTTLQREANRIYGYTAQQTLDYLQLLYEKKLATYPRTDSRYLTEDMAEGLPGLCQSVARAFPFASAFHGKVEAGQVIDGSRVSDHHAILPTGEVAETDLSALPSGERNILSLVAVRLLCAVCPDRYVHAETEVVLQCEGSVFTAKGREELSEGWKAVEKPFRAALREKPEEGQAAQALPGLWEGQTVTAEAALLRKGATSPPRRYTESALLGVMENAGAEEFARIGDVERKGLGTPATRAGVIEKLVKGGFAERKNRQLIPTERGMELVRVLPDTVKSAKLTAEWEAALKEVERGERPPEEFMEGITGMVRGLVDAYKDMDTGNDAALSQSGREAVGKCPKCGGDVVMGKFGAYCQSKCGMNAGRVMGVVLTDSQVKSMLEGKKTLVKGLKGKKGNYDAYLIPEGVEEYSYTRDGKKIKGWQYKIRLEFPPKKSR